MQTTGYKHRIQKMNTKKEYKKGIQNEYNTNTTRLQDEHNINTNVIQHEHNQGYKRKTNWIQKGIQQRNATLKQHEHNTSTKRIHTEYKH